MSSNASPIPAPDFSDARVKLGRARNHIAEVEAQIKSLMSGEFYRFRIKQTTQGRMQVIFDSLHQPDKALNAMIGDAIGNLRSFLDYVVVAIARPITGQPSGIGFPFADDANGFSGRVRSKGCLGHCDPIVQDFFIDEVQAYEGGKGHVFWVVNKLRNIDKHRLLIAATKIAGFYGSWRYQGATMTDCFIGVSEGENCILVDGPAGGIEFQDQPRPAFEVSFNEAAARNEPVLEILHRACGASEAFLNELEVSASRWASG